MGYLALEEVAVAAASKTAAGEVRDPASPLVGVGSGGVLVATAVPPAGVRPAPAADVARGRAAARAAGLRGGGAFLGCSLLGGGLGQWWANLDQASKDLDTTIFRDLSPTPIP
jgi:hypothetical protein